MRRAFSSSEEGQAAIDEWVLRHESPQTAIDLAIAEQEHLRRFFAEFGRYKVQFDVAFDQLVALVEQINYIDKSSWPPHRALQYMLLSHNLTPFISAVDRASKGYYEDSVAHSRTLYETFLRLVFISCYKDDPWGVFPLDATPKGTTRFNATNFPRDALRLNWQKMYRLMSYPVHSNSPDVIGSVTRAHRRDGDPEVFGLQLEYVDRELAYVLTYPPFLLAVFLRFLIERGVGEVAVHNPAQLASAGEALEWMLFVTAISGKPFWTMVIDDLDYIFHLMEVADDGGDWRALTKLRAEVPADGEPSRLR